MRFLNQVTDALASVWKQGPRIASFYMHTAIRQLCQRRLNANANFLVPFRAFFQQRSFCY